MNDADIQLVQRTFDQVEYTFETKLRLRALELAVDSSRAMPKRRIIETATKYLKFLKGDSE